LGVSFCWIGQPVNSMWTDMDASQVGKRNIAAFPSSHAGGTGRMESRKSLRAGMVLAPTAALAMVIAVCTIPTARSDTIEALGAEKCRGKEPTFQVDFIAPENTPVQVVAKVKSAGVSNTSESPALSVDGKPCRDGRCAFPAAKGQTYRLIADGAGLGFDELCITVGRP
jgi:hypothetical protein